MLDLLEKYLNKITADYAELRFHSRSSFRVKVVAGELEENVHDFIRGVGVRILDDGDWGFSSTAELSKRGILEAARKALKNARIASVRKKNRAQGLAEGRLAHGTFEPRVSDPPSNHTDEEKVSMVIDADDCARRFSDAIKSSAVFYREVVD